VPINIVPRAKRPENRGAYALRCACDEYVLGLFAQPSVTFR